MMLSTAALGLLLLAPAAMQDTTPPPAPSAATIAGAYRDPGARELVRRAREYRRTADRSVTAYRALARERTAAGLRTAFRERLLGGGEMAARVSWRRGGPVGVEVLGRRSRGVDDDDDTRVEAEQSARQLVFDPADERLRMGFVGRSTWIRHPLAEGSERDYRFRTGDTLTVRLSGGESVRVYELRVEPRHMDAPLVSGSIWLEDRGYGVVRTLLRLSHSLTDQLRTETSRDSAGRRQVSVSGGLSTRRAPRRGGSLALLPDVRVDVRYVTTEYGLVQNRWWMPTLTAVDATLTAGSFAVPVRFERSYSQYQVEGDPAAAPGTAVAQAPASTDEAEEDTVQSCGGVDCDQVRVTLPDSGALASSPELPDPITTGAPLMSGKEAGDLAGELRRVAADPWIFTRPSIRRAPLLLRYNRVEALSVGARQTVDFGPFAADGTLRIATATGEPDVEIGLSRESAVRRLRLVAYRRLTAANPAERPLSLSNSLGALLWGRDNGDYFRATGVELRGAPPRAERAWMEWRLFGEHQARVSRETDATFRGLFSGFDFRPNIAADPADQLGAALTLRPLVGARFLGAEWGAELGVEGQAGSFGFARPSATLRGALPLGGLSAAVEAAAGTTLGDVPVQSLWRLGGPGTLRGYDGSSAAGTAFWRGRGELGTGSGATRVALFSDVGWAGERGGFTIQRPLWSVGAGFSVLEGLFRVDLARALRQPTGWRLELYMDGAL